MNRIGRVFLPGLAFLAVTLMGFPQTSSAGADLHEAVANNNVDGARAELTAGTDPDTAGIVGLAPLHIAARAGHTEIALLLLEHGADVGARSDAGYTPLHAAAHGDNTEVARLLLDHGADVNAQDKSGFTPLHRASVYGHVDNPQAAA